MNEPMTSSLPSLVREHEERTREAVYPALLVLAAGYVAFLVLNGLGMEEPARTPLMVWDACLLVIFGSGALVMRRRRRPLSLTAASIVLGVAGLLTVSNALLAMVLDKAPGNTTYLLLLLFAGGFLLLETRWLVLFVVLALAGWIPAMLYVAPEGAVLHQASTVGAGVLASILLHVLRRRMVQRVAELRQQDETRKVELEQALARAERELEERQAAEQQRQREQEMRSELEQQLQQSQKMEALGTLAGGVAHDINNVLGAIMNLGALLERALPAESSERSDVAEILAACRRGRDLTCNLLGFARQGQQQRRRFDVNDVVCDVLELLERTTPRRIEIKRQLAPELPRVEGDPSQINQALLNIALNAIDALGGTGTLRVETTLVTLSETELPAGSYVEIRVRDDGVGIGPKELEHVFEPFFTTKPAHVGTGLGLAMVYGTAQQHGGRVLIDSEVDVGTTVTLQLPILDERAAHSSRRLPMIPEETRPLTVLVVDDEPLVRTATRRLLGSLGHTVILAADGQEALTLLAEHDEVDVVLLDLIMPVMDGRECFEQIYARYPQLPVVFCSGYSKGSVPIPDVAESDSQRYGFLHKPWAPEELEAVLVEVLSSNEAT